MSYIPAWMLALQTASWRGVPFATHATGFKTGRRIAMHEYPYRDTVFAEDLGRAPQQLSFTAFLVGDDVFFQRDALAQACETPGVGELVHPSLGAQQAVLLSSSFNERDDAGRTVEVELRFVVATDVSYPGLYPTLSINTPAASVLYAGEVDAAVADDFFNAVVAPIAVGAAVVNSVVDTAQHFVSSVHAVLYDASATVNAVKGMGSVLTGSQTSFGRYDGGTLPAVTSTLAGIDAGLSTVRRTTTAVSTLIGAANAARAGVVNAGLNVLALGAAL